MGKEKHLVFIILALYGGILVGLLEAHGTAYPFSKKGCNGRRMEGRMGTWKLSALR